MNNEPNELIEMLRDAREYTRFVGEMGVETVDEPSATIERAPVDTEPSVQFARYTSQPIGSSASSRPPSGAKTPTPVAAASSDSLFGDVAEPQPTFSTSAETLSDIWNDIGDCTRCGLCEGRTQVVNTHGNQRLA
jgi:hypothetical protein